MSAPLLEVRDLTLGFTGRRGQPPLRILRDVNFSIARGERVGLVGESGCGKSVTGLALMRLLPATAQIGGTVTLDGADMARASAAQVRRMRGKKIAMIFQEPMSALDPVFPVGEQLGEALRLHETLPRAEEKARVVQALADVGIPAPERRYGEYPHQLSGGMRQRVMIAMALINKPDLIIADEPTTALDVTIQAQIMDLLRDLSERTGTALLFITHDLGVVAETCQRMITMYAGEIVEDAPVDDALRAPKHPYTSGLLRSLPHFNRERGQFAYIPGRVPAPNAMPRGCRFAARCPHAASACAEPQVLREIEPGRRVRCIRAEALDLDGAVERSPA
ncbi:ABC transporter ATP-binding protein [Pseudooceanicola nanhaiensis]|jgi:peptide/nickel transport system ATP-binding protein|uniref:ABC transporter ATP-binding protein n=1 Tax=Pseudooceanicola nanhaiensis TaxID=375761 RepID=A0A917T0V5_9RHOB|nr:ABC transporter ATP-binding protein [Pseudooceanicola nanhaiensis]GGM04945.1 ABC transporter ATP-binding protein [Pseudooceanicola nanhaiensis]